MQSKNKEAKEEENSNDDVNITLSTLNRKLEVTPSLLPIGIEKTV